MKALKNQSERVSYLLGPCEQGAPTFLVQITQYIHFSAKKICNDFCNSVLFLQLCLEFKSGGGFSIPAPWVTHSTAHFPSLSPLCPHLFTEIRACSLDQGSAPPSRWYFCVAFPVVPHFHLMGRAKHDRGDLVGEIAQWRSVCFAFSKVLHPATMFSKKKNISGFKEILDNSWI